jgi:hypothetical protein
LRGDIWLPWCLRSSRLPIEQYLKLLFVIASESEAIQCFSATNLDCFVAYAPCNDEIPEW